MSLYFILSASSKSPVITTKSFSIELILLIIFFKYFGDSEPIWISLIWINFIELVIFSDSIVILFMAKLLALIMPYMTYINNVDIMHKNCNFFDVLIFLN